MATTKLSNKQRAKPNAAPAVGLTTADKARMALKPSVNGAVVVQAYQGNIMGKDADLNVLIDELRSTFTEVKGGDLHNLEAMLISQAKPRRCRPYSPAWHGGKICRNTKRTSSLFWGWL